MSTYRNVKAQIAKLEKMAADLLKKEVAVVIVKVRALIDEYGLTAPDLGLTGKAAKAVKATRKKKSASAKPAGFPLYADPVSGKTWTGKGKPPNWIVEGLKQGKAKTDFLISKATSAPAKVSKSVKTTKSVKVKVVPKAAKAPRKTAPVSRPAKKVARKTAVKRASAKAVAAKNEAAKG